MEKNKNTNFKKEVLMGNEAVVQGALEAGVDFVTMYPGCPSAEIGDEFGKIIKEHIQKNGEQNLPFYYEISTNEKVALESAVGASFSGLKSLVAMKNFGVNVCSEVLLPLLYTGTKGAMVIVVGDDPSCHSSAQTEENSRAFSLMAHIPTLEPADPQECRDFVKLGFEISEKFNIPVMVRTTIRVAHQRAPVEFEEVVKLNPSTPFGSAQGESSGRKTGSFVKNFHQYVTLPPRVLEMKKELLEKTEKIRAYFEKLKINKIENSLKIENCKLGIITSGVSHLHTMEALRDLEVNVSVLKIGSFYPLPKKKIADFIKRFKQVLVVEELDPYLERELKIIANDIGIKTKIIGKEFLPEIGELNVALIENAIAKILKIKVKKPIRIDSLAQGTPSVDGAIPRRTAKLCDGCPYWYALPTIKKLAPENVVWGGDIGCNMMTGLSPHNMQDYLFCMGSSIGIGHGVSKATGKNNKAITIMGDGTFFHSGMAGLINAVYNKSNPLMIILDNRITAMTGHQQNPGMGLNAMWQSAPEMNIEEIVKALGVKNVKTLDQGNPGELESTMREFLAKDDVSVIICKRICTILDRRQKRNKN